MNLAPYTSDGINFIDEIKRKEIISSIKRQYWSHIRAKGYFIVVKPYVRAQKEDGLLIPEAMRFEDTHHSVDAQVIDIGPVAYTDKSTCGGIAWVQIGDWVTIPRVAGTRKALNVINADNTKETVTFRIVKEDDIIAVINDPSEWEIRVNATKF